MIARLLRPALLLALLALGLAGCADKSEPVTFGETEGTTLEVGNPPLGYQVQLSRQLNPNDIEDRAYLRGLPAGVAPPTAQQTWFAVFLRVQNENDSPQLSSRTFELVDTQFNRYKPIDVQNPFAYRQQRLESAGGGAASVIPNENSVDAYAPTQGTLLLFKIDYDAFANRPLRFIIKSPLVPQKVGSIDLDL